jgi:hypothetical protein
MYIFLRLETRTQILLSKNRSVKHLSVMLSYCVACPGPSTGHGLVILVVTENILQKVICFNDLQLNSSL